jgi:hypothetical protein
MTAEYTLAATPTNALASRADAAGVRQPFSNEDEVTVPLPGLPAAQYVLSVKAISQGVSHMVQGVGSATHTHTQYMSVTAVVTVPTPSLVTHGKFLLPGLLCL